MYQTEIYSLRFNRSELFDCLKCVKQRMSQIHLPHHSSAMLSLDISVAKANVDVDYRIITNCDHWNSVINYVEFVDFFFDISIVFVPTIYM